MSTFTPIMLQAILPEILLLVLALVVLVYDLFLRGRQRRYLGWLTAGGLGAIMVIILIWGRPTSTEVVWGGMVHFDWMAYSLKLMFLFAAAITCLFSMEMDAFGQRGEFYLLMLVSTLGMNLMASAGDLVMLYLAIETTSIPLYVLAGFLTRDLKSTESGFKYILFGALTSTIMLYGFSLLYGFSGTTSLYGLADTILRAGLDNSALLASLLLILVGFGFKVSVVPFHFWAPDVYEGAPTPIAGFLSTASKAAGFAVLLRFLLNVAPPFIIDWSGILAIIAVVTMTLGNVLALAQRNIKRLLAYSSIAHAGYIMIGIVAMSHSALGIVGVVFYLIAYIVTNLAAFGIVATFWCITGSDEIADYAGMSRRSPGLAFAMLVAFLSLAGMPPLGGFVAKVFVFAAAVDASFIWLAVVGVLNSIIGLYYYLTVLKVVYLYRSENDDKPLPIPRPYAIALVVLTAGIVLVGTAFAPFFEMGVISTVSLLGL